MSVFVLKNKLTPIRVKGEPKKQIWSAPTSDLLWSVSKPIIGLKVARKHKNTSGGIRDQGAAYGVITAIDLKRKNGDDQFRVDWFFSDGNRTGYTDYFTVNDAIHYICVYDLEEMFEWARSQYVMTPSGKNRSSFFEAYKTDVIIALYLSANPYPYSYGY